MFRMLARTAVIFILAAIVASALYLTVASRGPSPSDERLAQASSASVNVHFGHRRGGGWGGRSPDRGERRGREEASLGHGVAGMAGTALQVGLVGAVVVGLQKTSRHRQRRRRGE